MASGWTQNAFVYFMATLATDTIKGVLLKDTFTLNPDNKFVSSLASYECDATGYTGGFGGAGRKTLTSKTLVVDDANNRATFSCASPVTWSALGGAVNNSLKYMALVKEITNDAASIIVAVLDFGTAYNTNSGDFNVAINAAGIGYINV